MPITVLVTSDDKHKINRSQVLKKLTDFMIFTGGDCIME